MQSENSTLEEERIKNLAVLALCLFLMPAIAWFTGACVMRQLNASFGDQTASSQRTDVVNPRAQTLRTLALCESTRTSTGGGTVDATLAARSRTCEALSEVRLVRHLAVWTAAVGVLLLLLIVGARRYAGTDRARLARVFGPVVQVVMVLLAASTFAQAGLFVYSAFAIEMLTLHGVHLGVLVAAVAAAMSTCYALIRSAFAAMKDEPLIIQAVALNRTEHPAAFRLVDETAATLTADAPDHIIVGLEPTFFVTICDVMLASEGGEVLRGRTLFLSLSLMGVLSVDELRGVIGHELGHFRGDDLDYSLKFAPTYARLRRTIVNLDQSAGIAATVGRIPAMAALSTCLLEFASAERAVGRARELLADQFGVQVTGARTYAIALVKSALVTSRWDEFTRLHVDLLRQGHAMPQLSEAYALRCRTFLGTLNARAALEALTASVQMHPVDTHPQLLLRFTRLRFSLNEIDSTNLAQTEIPAARSLLDDAGTIDKEISALWTRAAIGGGAGRSN